MPFGISFGSKKSSSTTTENQTQTGSKDVVSKSTGEKTNKQTGTSTSLDEGLNQFLTNFSKEIGKNLGQSAENIQVLAEDLVKRARGAEDAVNTQSGAILSEARRTGNLELGKLETSLARAAGGSKSNTLVAAATAEARSGMESQLAALGAQLSLQARDTGTQELGMALQGLALQPDMSGLVGLVNSIKGAKVTSNIAGTETADTSSTENTTFEQFLKSVGTSSSKSKDSSFGFKTQGFSF